MRAKRETSASAPLLASILEYSCSWRSRAISSSAARASRRKLERVGSVRFRLLPVELTEVSRSLDMEALRRVALMLGAGVLTTLLFGVISMGDSGTLEWRDVPVEELVDTPSRLEWVAAGDILGMTTKGVFSFALDAFVPRAIVAGAAQGEGELLLLELRGKAGEARVGRVLRKMQPGVLLGQQR